MIQQQIDKQNSGASKLQRLWRAYTNRKIYKYYRDIINFKCKGDPAKLLKGINPSEGYLLQTSSNCHVRFKLGGEFFPPIIYYKIFTSCNVIDINAFAPRDYAALPRKGQVDKLAYSQYVDHKSEYQKQGWYLRCDNNGWRPVNQYQQRQVIRCLQNQIIFKTLVQEKYSIIISINKKDRIKHLKKLNQNKWLKQIYANAKQTKLKEVQEKEQGQSKEEQDSDIELYDPSKHNKAKLEDLDDQDWDDDQVLEKQIKDLLDWSDNLDYTQYAKYWFSLSTSQPSNARFLQTTQAAYTSEGGFQGTYLTEKK